MYSAKKMGTCGIHNLNPLCTHPRLEVRNAELYDYWCPDANKVGYFNRITYFIFLPKNLGKSMLSGVEAYSVVGAVAARARVSALVFAFSGCFQGFFI